MGKKRDYWRTDEAKAYRLLYGRKKWKDLRKAVLEAQPLCVYCLRNGFTREADVVDHIVPHKGDLDLFHDIENLQPLCHFHHDSVKAMEENGAVFTRFDEDGYPIEDGDQ